MDENPDAPIKRSRRHLLTPENLARAGQAADSDTDLTRHHGQSNGLRIHGIYIAVLSAAALVALIVVAIVLGARMM